MLWFCTVAPARGAGATTALQRIIYANWPSQAESS